MQHDMSDQMADVLARYRALCDSPENLRSNRFFEKNAFVSFGACYSASLFGAQIEFPPARRPGST